MRQLDLDSEGRYTTVELLARERQIVDGAERRASEQLGVVGQQLVDSVLTRYQPTLNDDQAAAVREVTSSGRGIDALQALAGTGKTTIIGALAACYQLAGWRVIGAAPTARAARQLREVAGIPAGTMHALVGELECTGGFAPRTVLVIDEAGMAPTRLTAELFAAAEQADVKVVAVGDPGQLGSIEAGGWLAALTSRQPGPALRVVVRQRDPQERAALAALHDGQPQPYLTYKQHAITVHMTEAEALSAIVEHWDTARQEHGLSQAVMIARDNQTRQLLNETTHEQLRRDGILPSNGTLIGGREYAPGDRVIARRNDRHLDVDNGTLATIIQTDAGRGCIRVRTDAGQSRELCRGYVAAHVEHAYALTAHGTQGATVAWAGVIGRPEEFNREWVYTALSRAREQTVLHVIAERSEREHEHEGVRPCPARPQPAGDPPRAAPRHEAQRGRAPRGRIAS